MKRQKSISSQAESISAWNTVFDCPSMVEALSVSRQLVVSRSAALRNTAARSSQAQLAHSTRASRAAAIAAVTSSGRAWWKSARTWPWSWGITERPRSPVRTHLPPMTSGISTRSPAIAASRALIEARSGDPGA